MTHEEFIMNACRFEGKLGRPFPLPEPERFNHEASESHLVSGKRELSYAKLTDKTFSLRTAVWLSYGNHDESPYSRGVFFPEIRERFSKASILKKIEPRIEELRKIALEEASDGQLPLSNDSRRGLIGFLDKIVGLGLDMVPGLVLTYEGNIRAEWHSSPDERLALEFTDSTHLKFVFFYPDPCFPDRILRISGSGSVKGFLDDQPRALQFLRSLITERAKPRFYGRSISIRQTLEAPTDGYIRFFAERAVVPESPLKFTA